MKKFIFISLLIAVAVGCTSGAPGPSLDTTAFHVT